MFATAFNAIVARCLVGLATAMLLLPSLPDPACGCSAEEQVQSSSCRGEGQAEVHRDKVGCCCSSKNRHVDGCCEQGGQRAVSTPERSCRCGPTCQCGHAQLPDPQPAAPIAPGQNNTERSQCASLACVLPAADVDQSPSSTQADDDTLAAASTALERCISLSRFQC